MAQELQRQMAQFKICGGEPKDVEVLAGGLLTLPK